MRSKEHKFLVQHLSDWAFPRKISNSKVYKSRRNYKLFAVGNYKLLHAFFKKTTNQSETPCYCTGTNKKYKIIQRSQNANQIYLGLKKKCSWTGQKLKMLVASENALKKCCLRNIKQRIPAKFLVIMTHRKKRTHSTTELFAQWCTHFQPVYNNRAVKFGL